MYDMAPTNKTVANPEKPLIAADTYRKYTDQLKYIMSKTVAISKHAPIMATSKAGFLLPPLSVHGPHRGATTRDGMDAKRL